MKIELFADVFSISHPFQEGEPARVELRGIGINLVYDTFVPPYDLLRPPNAKIKVTIEAEEQ